GGRCLRAGVGRCLRAGVGVPPRPVRVVTDRPEAVSSALRVRIDQGVQVMARKREAPAPRRELTESDLRGLTWRSVGPANMGGRVSDIAIAPGNARTFFVGLATG